MHRVKHLHKVGFIYMIWGGILSAASIVIGYFLYKDTLMFLASEPRCETGGMLLLLVWGILISFLLISVGYLIVGKSFCVDKKLGSNKLGFTLAILSLPIFPVGTTIGVYTIWVLNKYNRS